MPTEINTEQWGLKTNTSQFLFISLVCKKRQNLHTEQTVRKVYLTYLRRQTE